MPQIHINPDSLLGSTTNTNHTGTRTETEGDRENKKKGTTEETEDYNIPWRLPCCHPLMRRTTGAHTNKLKQDKESEIHVESLDPTLSPPDPYQDPTSGCGGSIIMFCQLVRVCRAYVGAGQLIAHRLVRAPLDLDIFVAMDKLTILEIASIATASSRQGPLIDRSKTLKNNLGLR